MPHGTTATTHILKPRIGRLPNGIDLSNSVENEHFCLELVAALGLSVAKSQIVDFVGKRVLSIERFDRTRTRDGRLLRLPQEDCCRHCPCRRLASMSPTEVPASAIFTTCSREATPRRGSKNSLQGADRFLAAGCYQRACEEFQRPVVARRRFRLTPLYDIVSAQPSLDTKQISRNRMKLAMAMGKNRHYVVHTILGRHFKQTADAYGLPSKAFNQIVQELGDTAKQKIDETLSKLPPDFPPAVPQSISDGAKRRIGALTAA